MREDLPKQANRSITTPNNLKMGPKKDNYLSDNHQSSVNQPIFILPYCDQQCHGKGEAGGTFFLGWLLKNCQNTCQMNFRDWWQISCKRPLSASPGRALRLHMFWRCQSCPRPWSTNFKKSQISARAGSSTGLQLAGGCRGGLQLQRWLRAGQVLNNLTIWS